MYLFFDTETTGVPRNYKAPATDLNNWPRLVQLGWVEVNQQGKIITKSEFIVKPQGFQIPADAAKVHGITTEKALAEGDSLTEVLTAFSSAVSEAKTLVAHNMAFDEKIVGAEFLRAKMADLLAQKRRLCTMLGSTNFCRLPGAYGYKWPKLAELYRVLFNTPIKESHNSLADVQVCVKCFFELQRLGVLT